MTITARQLPLEEWVPGVSPGGLASHSRSTEHPTQVPAPFEYEQATSVEHALELLERLGPDARLLAGGHSLLPMMKLRLATPGHLVDIDPLAAELGYIREAHSDSDGTPEVRIGAMTRHRELLRSRLLERHLTIFTDAERVIADPLVRNRGTIGGALCQADPSEDLSAVCAAIGARMVVRGIGGERVLEMPEFHVGPYRTAIGPAEMLIEIRVPFAAESGSAYQKLDRRAGDWAVAAAGAALRLHDGRIESAGIALAAVGADIISVEAERILIGERPVDEVLTAAARVAAEHARPVTDQRGSAEYKRHAVGVLVERALRVAATRALKEPA